MARKKLLCASCETKISPQAFCSKCGAPTSLASSEERILWELGQWETSRKDVPEPPPQKIVLTRLAAARMEREAEKQKTARRRVPTGEPDRSFEMKPVAVPTKPRVVPLPETPAMPVQPAARADEISAASAQPAREAAAPEAETQVAEAPREASTTVETLEPPAPAEPARPKLDRAALIARLTQAARNGATQTTPPQDAATTARLLREAATEAADTTAAEALRELAAGEARTGVIAPKPAAAVAPPVEAPPEPEQADEPAAPAKPTRAERREAKKRAKQEAERAKAEAAAAEQRAREEEAAAAARAAEAQRLEREAEEAERLQAEEAAKEAERAALEREKTELARRKQEVREARKQRRQRKAAPADATSDPAEEAEVITLPRRRTDKRLDRTLIRLGLKEGEEVVTSVEGRSGVHRVTFVVTSFRVAVVPRSRRAKIRWIPVEEVAEISTAWRGAPTILVDHAAEHLSFRKRSAKSLEPLLETLRDEVRSARKAPGSRHSAEVDQEWCDRVGEVWDSETGRLRLWIRRHPLFTVTWLGSVVAVTYLISVRAHL